MEIYRTIAELTNQTFQIPIYIYCGAVLEYSLPVQDPVCHPPIQYIKKLLDQESLLLFTDEHACFCKIRCKDTPDITLVLGPVSSLSCDSSSLVLLHKEYIVPMDKRQVFDDFFRKIPVMTHIDFFYILRIVYFMINKEVLATDLFMRDLYCLSTSEMEEMHNEQVLAVYEKREFSFENNSYEIEKQFLALVESGDIEGIKNFASSLPQYHAGTVAGNALRMQKNYFIATYTLAVRAAIRAGVPTADAYQLSDLYINKMESMNSMNSVNRLFLNAVIDITALVKKNKNVLEKQALEDLARPVRDCIAYIKKHISEALSVQSVADALGYHRVYLSSLFSKTMGIHLNDFIYRCKLEESKSLLAHTDKPISEISNYLGFSCQSPFQTRFKKAFHMTPAKYREIAVVCLVPKNAENPSGRQYKQISNADDSHD